MPQTNLYFFNEISLGIIFFWLIGYAVFFRFIVGRLLYVFKARDFLTQRMSERVNPLYSLALVQADFVYLEGFLFSLEFLLLLYLVVKFFSAQVDSKVIHVEFVLRSQLNPFSVNQAELVVPLSNLIRLFNKNRSSLYYSRSYYEVNLLSTKVIEQLFQPYNQQIWLVQLFESFLPLLNEEVGDEEGEDE